MKTFESQLDALSQQIAERIVRGLQQKVQLKLPGVLEGLIPPRQLNDRRRRRSMIHGQPQQRDLDEVDTRILGLLTQPMSVETLTKEAKLSVSTAHRRVALLKSERRIKGVREGTRVLYMVAPRRGPKKKIKTLTVKKKRRARKVVVKV